MEYATVERGAIVGGNARFSSSGALNQSEPTKPVEMSAALDALHERTAVLQKMLGELRGRLAGVLREVPALDKDKQPSYSGLTPITRSIAEATCRTEESINQVRIMLDLLEI